MKPSNGNPGNAKGQNLFATLDNELWIDFLTKRFLDISFERLHGKRTRAARPFEAHRNRLSFDGYDLAVAAILLKSLANHLDFSTYFFFHCKSLELCVNEKAKGGNKKTPHQRTGFDSAAFLERVKGVEPSYKAWEAFILPLNYTRNSVSLNA